MIRIIAQEACYCYVMKNPTNSCAMKRIFPLVFLLILSTGSPAFAQAGDSTRSHLSDYAGQEQRIIKNFSEDDIRELSNGEGWGLAKAAELNGVPGPRHVLDMKAEIKLDSAQVRALETLFSQMKEDATALGHDLIEKERKLNEAFASREVDQTRLRELLMEISHTTYQLRFVHLEAHLETEKILTGEQVAFYNRLRGYTSGDPCENIPEGHDAELWKRHNNCN